MLNHGSTKARTRATRCRTDSDKRTSVVVRSIRAYNVPIKGRSRVTQPLIRSTSSQLLATSLFSVERRVYLQPGAAAVERDVVVHPGAVVILPLLDAQRLVMIRNYRYTVERELWELPAGTIEPNEEPIETARRELEEETGYRAGQIQPFMEFYTSPGIMTERMHAFVANDLRPVGQNLRGGERILPEVIDIDTVRRRLIGGFIQDGKTLAVLGTFFLRKAPGIASSPNMPDTRVCDD